MLRQKSSGLFRLVVSSARLNGAQPELLLPLVQTAFRSHGGPGSGSSPSDEGPQTDAFTEKLQEKGMKELESLTFKTQDDDDWVDVWPACLHAFQVGPCAKDVPESGFSLCRSRITKRERLVAQWDQEMEQSPLDMVCLR